MTGWPSASTCRLIGRPSAWAASRQRGAVSCAASRTTLLRSTGWLSCSGAARVNSSSRLTVSPPSRAAWVVVVSKSSSSARFWRILDQRLPGQVAVAGHQHQRLIEIVGDAAGHLAERAQLLRLRHRLALLLGLLGFGDVLGVEHDGVRRHEHVADCQIPLAARRPIAVAHLTADRALLGDAGQQIDQNLGLERVAFRGGLSDPAPECSLRQWRRRRR